MIDITFDFETCAICPTAAVMSMAAVVWNREGENTPFIENSEIIHYPTYSAHVDLRGMFVDGFTFDNATAQWWSGRSDEAKAAVLDEDSYDTPCSHIRVVVKSFFDWIKDIKEATNESVVNLWCQGTDFDIAILRNICYKYGIENPISYRNFRDHRTFFMEGAAEICRCSGIEFEPANAYSLVDNYEGDGSVHDPIYDCKRSIFSTWQMMQHLRCLPKCSK